MSDKEAMRSADGLAMELANAFGGCGEFRSVIDRSHFTAILAAQIQARDREWEKRAKELEAKLHESKASANRAWKAYGEAKEYIPSED